MTKALRRIRGAIGMGLTWAAAWAVGGLLIGVTSRLLPALPWDAFFAIYDAPLPTLALPGFVAGLLFSIVLGVAARRRRFDELSLPRFAAWGAAGGLLLSLVPAAAVALGLASLGTPEAGLWRITAVISGPFTLLSALSAAGSLLLARRTEQRVARGRGERLGATLRGGGRQKLLDAERTALDAGERPRSGSSSDEAVVETPRERRGRLP